MTKKIKDISIYLYFFKYLLKYKFLILILILSIIGYSIFNGASLSLIKPLIDDVFFKSQIKDNKFLISQNPIKLSESKFRYIPVPIKNFIIERVKKINNYLYNKLYGISFKKLIKILSIIIFITIFLKLLCLYIRNYLTQYIGNVVVINIREDAYKNLLNLSMNFFDRSKTGEIMSILINDTQALLSSIILGISDLLFYLFQILILLFLVIYIDFKFALLSTIIICLLLLPILQFNKRLKKRGYFLQQSWANMLNLFQEALTGINVVKSFGMENYEIEKSKAANREVLKHTMKTAKYIILASPITEMAGMIAALIILIIGTNKIIDKELTAGAFILFITALLSILSPLKRLIEAASQVFKSIGAADRLFKLMRVRASVKEKKDAIELNNFRTRIEFKDVWFGYDKKNFIIKNFNLIINKGEIVAIVGRSGSGKTTLLNLIPRFYDVTKGEILFDNINIKDIKLKFLINLIAIVSQETFLFNDTIKSNIAYGLKSISFDEIVRAAKTANAHEFIMQLKDGYDTNVGENGVLLSGGQRQRIAIARAILKNPPILLLDEATSSLDTESEMLVQQALDNLMHNRTTIVVAHRLSTIINSDKIVVIEDGEIKETGSHNNLLNLNGIYKKLYDLQFNV